MRYAASRFANSRARGSRRSVTVLAALVFAAIALIPAAPASAALSNSKLGATIGPDGTSATSFSHLNHIAFDKTSKHLYALGYEPAQIYGVDVTTPGAFTAVGGNFPVPVISSSGDASDLTVDNSGLASNGNLYYSTGGFATEGFEPNGNHLAAWNPFYAPGGCGVAVDPAGNVAEGHYSYPARAIEKFTTGGSFISALSVAPLYPCVLGYDSNGDLYYGGHSDEEQGGLYGPVYKRTASSGYTDVQKIDPDRAIAIAVDRASHTVFVAHSNRVTEYSSAGKLLQQFADDVTQANFKGLALDEVTGTVYVADSTSGKVLEYPRAIAPDVTTGSASDVATTSATVSGHIDPVGGGDITDCRVEYGSSSSYGLSAPCQQATPFSGAQDVSAQLIGLKPSSVYHFRFKASNANATSAGEDGAPLHTLGTPAIVRLTATNVTASSVDLTAEVNPEGTPTTYHFVYGPTSAYGTRSPLADAPVASDFNSHEVSVHLDNLEAKTYHFAVVATNDIGTVTSSDSSFSFYPPACPNEHIRQQTGSAFLPDCRAYELVSPESIGNAVIFPAGPISATATSPSRVSFGGGIGGIPGTGDPQTGLSVDTYVATRTTQGWSTRYIGLGGSKGFSHGGTAFEGVGQPSGIRSDTSLDTFVDWNTGAQKFGVHQLGSLAAYRWSSDGRFLGRLPTNVDEIPNSTADLSNGGFVGTARLSGDGRHYFFSSGDLAFTPDGLNTGSGSVYDNDIAAETVKKISVLSNGEDIPHEPGALTPDFLNIPAASTDGSHVLIEAPIKGVCGTGTCGAAPFVCGAAIPEFFFERCPTKLPSHLYMRVGDALTYDVSEGHTVKFLAMTKDGSEVVVSSTEHLTSDDHDSSTDLFAWNEKFTPHFTKISGGPGGTGDSDQCAAKWITGCDAEFITTGLISYTVLALFVNTQQTPSDDTVASRSGDVLFYSPEVLTSGGGVPGARNLYLYRNGETRFIASLSDPSVLNRVQISPDGNFVAFITDARLTSYDNSAAGGTCSTNYPSIPHTSSRCQEMYVYETQPDRLYCASCRPDGALPSHDVEGSLGGRFMTDDGRVFFTTAEPLVDGDTDGLRDTYEYVESRPQLITSGTGTTDYNGLEYTGLVGVSANGTDVYFTTTSSFVPQDKLGLFVKVYDARTGGGFQFEPEAAPCEAADECHGPGSETPAAIEGSTSESLGGGGNHKARKAHKKHRKHGHRRKPKAKRKHRDRQNRLGTEVNHG